MDGAESIVYDELTRIMTITLPAPELQSCFLDESQSYVVRRSTGFFADPMDNLEDELRLLDLFDACFISPKNL